MIQEEKLEKICTNFSRLSGEQQDYIIGIMQALIFANSSPHLLDAKTELTDTQDARPKSE